MGLLDRLKSRGGAKGAASSAIKALPVRTSDGGGDDDDDGGEEREK